MLTCSGYGTPTPSSCTHLGGRLFSEPEHPVRGGLAVPSLGQLVVHRLAVVPSTVVAPSIFCIRIPSPGAIQSSSVYLSNSGKLSRCEPTLVHAVIGG